MTTLRATLDELAQSFANAILEAIRNVSLGDLQTEGAEVARGGRGRGAAARASAGRVPTPPSAPKTGRNDGRPARRSPADVDKTLGLVVAAVKAGPMRAEEIQRFLKLDKRELPRVLRHGVASKKLKSKGTKRATVYSAA